MHMADALISAPVGGAFWAATAGITAHCARRLKLDLDERKVPLMGVLGAFIFAAQMINFTIPATGSSGHLGGGLLLAILLGPHAALITIASVLTVQALFFADGGLLALGCNVFNLGVLPCFIAYPLIYKRFLSSKVSQGRLVFGCTLAAIVALELGAAGVVGQTVFSGRTELPFAAFLALMLPIHLAIGLVEGLVTAAVVSFVWQARPELVDPVATAKPLGVSIKPVLVGLLGVAMITGVVVSWFASAHPDGLEWAVARTTGQEELQGLDGGLHSSVAGVQEVTAFLPDYGFKAVEESEVVAAEEEADMWPAVNAGTSASGLVGGGLTLVLAGLIGVVLKKRVKRT